MALEDKAQGFLVSAIVSTYNAEKHIRGCLEDLESQTIADRIQIIVVDGGSEENEKAVVEEFQNRYNNIVYIHSDKRITVYEAWNRGILASSGKYLTNANTDDRHHHNAFERMAGLLEENPDIAVVYADVAVTEKEISTFESSKVIGHFLWPDFDPLLLYQTCYVGPQPMWRSDLHKSYGYFDKKFTSAGDYEFWLRIAGKERFHHIPETLGTYLVSHDGIENRDPVLSCEETELARIRYWSASWGDRPVTGGSFLVPVHPSEAAKSYSEQHYFSAGTRSACNLQSGPLVSIILPTYNRRNLLAEALRSISIQTYRNYEVLVINDGGEDVSDVINPFRRIIKVTYIAFDKRKGPAAARNCGLERAAGKYIAYLDDDDIYYANHLETLIGTMEMKRCEFVYSDSYQTIQKKDGMKYITVERKISYEDDFDRQKLLIKNYIPTLNIIHRKDCIRETGLFDETLETHEDWDLWIRMAQHYDFYHIRELTAEFRTRETPDNISTKKAADFLITLKIIHTKYSHLVADSRTRKAQKIIEDLHETKIKQKEKVSLYHINTSSIVSNAIDCKISVLVPFKKDRKHFSELLENIRRQRKIRDVEIIVMVEDPGDDAYQAAKEFGTKVVALSPGKNSIGELRNQAVSEATGTFIVFIAEDASLVSRYWLYSMTRPFQYYPELSVISSRQYPEPESDLFELWTTDNMTKSKGFEKDSIGQLHDAGEINWRLLDNEIKRRLAYFNSSSSCIRKEVFNDIKFNGWANIDNIDIDFGIKLLANGKVTGYTMTTGVSRCQKSDADDLFRRSYTISKDLHILMNDLPFFFDVNCIKFENLMSNIMGIYDLIRISMKEWKSIETIPVQAVGAFFHILKENLDSLPIKIDGKTGNEAMCTVGAHENMLVTLLMRHSYPRERLYDFRHNLLLPHFMNYFSLFAEFLCGNKSTLKGRQKDFVSSIYKIFSLTAGEALGAYYHESEIMNNVPDELIELDELVRHERCRVASGLQCIS